VETMKKSRNFVLAAIAWVAVAASLVSAQVMSQVPSNALVVLKVSNLQATSKEVATATHAIAAKTKFLDFFMVSTLKLAVILPALGYRRKKAK